MARSGTTKSKMLARRNRRGQQERRNRWLKRGLALLLLLALCGGVAYSGLPDRAAFAIRRGWYRRTSHDGFVVRNLLVQGRVNLDPRALRDVLNVNSGDPLMAFDPADAAAALKRLSWVRDVRVERRLPDTVYVKITERQPVALWQAHGKLRLIDAEGVVLTDRDLQKFQDLPLIVGEDAPAHAADIFKVLSAVPDLGRMVEAAMWVSGSRWDLRLKSGVTLQLPSTDTAAALQRLSSDEGKAALGNKDVTIIDLREAGRMSVRTKPVIAPAISKSKPPPLSKAPPS